MNHKKKNKVIFKIFFIILFFLPGNVVTAEKPYTLSESLKKADEYFSSLRYDSAEVLYLQVLKSIKPDVQKELYCKVLNNYALSLLWQDKLVDSKSVCYNNLENCIRLFGNNHTITADAHQNLGIYKMMAASYENVETNFLMAAYINEEINGKNHASVAKAYEWLGTYFESNADTIKSR